MSKSTSRRDDPHEGNSLGKVTTIRVTAIGLFAMAAFLMASPFVIQTSVAQMQTENFIVRLVGAVGQAGLVNIAVNNVVVGIPIDISNNNVIVPVTANVQANVPVTICAISVLSGAPVGCRTVNENQQDNQQIITIPISQRPQ